MIEEYKNVVQEVKNINSDIRELKITMQNLRETIQDLIKSTENFASSHDLKVLEKYINMWSPLNFVTEKEVEQIIKENG